MIDIENEDLLNPAMACRERVFRNPKTGKPIASAQFYRYVTLGARSVNGGRVRLETIKTPGGVRTSREAIARFIAALNSHAASAPPPSARRKSQIARAEQELAAAGFELQ